MRKALIGILIATTAATPLAAQDGGSRDRAQGSPQQHEQKQAQPQQRQAPQGQRFQGRGGWTGQRGVQQQQQAPQGQRFQGGWAGQRGVQQQAPAQVQPQAQGRGAWQGRGATGWGGQSRFQGQGAVANQRNYAPQQGRNYQGNRYSGGNRQGWGGGSIRWDRGWRNNSRYDWQRYRYANRGVFHLGPYYAPYRDYYYNPLEIGIVLDSPFFDRNYWIDPAYYDLPVPPPGAEWVRYYNDVVLVDMETGQVLDVIRDFFW